MSRADLARRSGLQRSTVSAIIDQLIDEGWVTEGAIGRRRAAAGRVSSTSTSSAPASSPSNCGPETTTVGLAGVDARFVEQTSWPTPSEPEAFVRKLARTVTALPRAHPRILCEGVGVSLPGRVDDDGPLVFAPNLGWGDVDLRPLLEAAIGMPVVVENAANACALAELWFGRHPEHVRNLVAVTVSEGIGVGLLDERAAGARRPRDGRRVRPRHARRERAALPVRQARLLGALRLELRRGPALRWSQWRRARTRRRHSALRRLAARCRAGRPRAVEALERMARFLGIGLAGLITGLAPEVIVVIGEVTAAWDRVGPIVDDVVKRRALPQRPTRIVPTDPPPAAAARRGHAGRAAALRRADVA